MNYELLTIVIPAAAGLLLGGFFFGGLWWTVKKGLTVRQPALLFLSSFIIRTAVVLAGFYFASCGKWQNIVACLAGFILVRFILSRFLPNNQIRAK